MIQKEPSEAAQRAAKEIGAEGTYVQELAAIIDRHFVPLVEQNERYKRALEQIHRHTGKVCDHFEHCTHRACQSSYTAWSLADEALMGEKEEPTS